VEWPENRLHSLQLVPPPRALNRHETKDRIVVIPVIDEGLPCASKRSVRGFDETIAPLARDTFLANWWGTELLHQQGPAGRYTALLPWSTLTEMLETQRFAAENLRLVQGGKRLDVERYAQPAFNQEQLALKSGALGQCLAAGATLVLSHVEEHVPALRQLADSVGDDLRANTTVNLYASFGAEEGFDLHWDSQENFILQLAGRKHWSVYRSTRDNPVIGELNAAKPPVGEPTWEGVLEDGDLLYLPRGWWHVARALNGPSLHLTLTVEPPLGGHLLEWLAAELRSHPLARMNLPHLAKPSEQVAHAQRLLALIALASPEGLIERFLAAREASTLVSPRLRLPAAPARPHRLHAGTLLRLAVCRRLAISVLEDADLIAVWAVDRHWLSSSTIAPALRVLRSTSVCSLADLDACLPSAHASRTLRIFLGVLILAGVVDIE